MTTIAERFAGVTTADQAVKVITTVGGQYQRALGSLDSKLLDAAYATWQAVQFDLIREGRKTKDSPEVRWEHEEYANLYDGGSGTVKSQVGLWIVLGYCLVVLDLAPDSDLIKRLRKGLQFGPVKAKARATDNTPESIAELATFVDMFVDENGRKRSKAARIEMGSGETQDQRQVASENDNGGEAVKAEPVTADNAPTVMRDLILMFAEVAKHLDDAKFAAAVKGIEDKIRAEKASRDKAAKAEVAAAS